jgi:hypothetical protein
LTLSSQIPLLLEWKRQGEQTQASENEKMYSIGAKLLIKDKLMSDPTTARNILNNLKSQKPEFTADIDTYLKNLELEIITAPEIQKDEELIKYRRANGLRVGESSQYDDKSRFP